MDTSERGANAHLQRRNQLVRQLMAPPSEGGLGLDPERVSETVRKAEKSVCEKLYKRRIGPDEVDHKMFDLFVWHQIYKHALKQDFPWTADIRACIGKGVDIPSSKYAAYYEEVESLRQTFAAMQLEKGMEQTPTLPAPQPQPQTVSKGPAATSASAATVPAPVTPVEPAPAAQSAVKAKGKSIETPNSRAAAIAPAPKPAPAMAKLPLIVDVPRSTNWADEVEEFERSRQMSQARPSGTQPTRQAPEPVSSPSAPTPFIASAQPSGSSQSAWTTVEPPKQSSRRKRARAPIVSGAPPETLPLPGLRAMERQQQIQQERIQQAHEQLREQQRQTAAQRVEDGLRGYTPPAYRMPARKRLAVWRQLFGDTLPVPDSPLGAFELATEGKTWCFERCYGSNGHILQRTLSSAIDRQCTVWFEAGPDGRPFGKLVVGLKDDGHATDHRCRVLLETWLNIRVWRDSDSRQNMANGVRDVRERYGSKGVFGRAVDLLRPSDGPAPRPTSASTVPATPSRRQAPARTLGPAALRYVSAVQSGDEEVDRLRTEIEGRMGKDRSPQEVKQAMTAWYHDVRSAHLTRESLARMAVGVWITKTYGTPRAADHQKMANEWLDETLGNSEEEC